MKKGLAVGYWNEKDFKRLDALATRAIQAIAKLQRYLRSPKAKSNADRCRPKGAKEDEDARNDTKVSNGPNERNGSNDPNVPNDTNDTNA